jgi:AcrR family transcriptional regulator
LFAERGYVDTTVDAIALRAGVVKQTVYLAAGTKPQLLRAVENLAWTADQPSVESHTHDQLLAIARHIRTVAERAAPVRKAVREAAVVDADIAGYLVRAGQLRHADQAAYARMIPPGSLRSGLDHEDVADTLWAIASPEMVDLLIGQRGWSFDRLERWLGESLVRLLLPDGSAH